MNAEQDVQFIKERDEQIKQEEEEKRLAEEKRKEAERRKEEERVRLEEEKRQEEQEQQKAKQESQQNNEDQKQKETQSQEPKENKSDSPDNSSYPGVTSFEKEVVKYTNQARKDAGLPELKLDHELSRVAWFKSKDMQTLDYFAHQSPTYGSPFEMMTEFGLHYTYAGENIAYGYPTAKRLVQGWMDSPPHRENILNENFTHIGVGHVPNGHYATQMFRAK
ncbi:CAP domain-containing protein [Ornithinibacillus halophilus]|uniref:CAP domain-containing protein n=1 Tax=Ornithinibacillus halophilus TaxID=930117 RepID=UPI001F41115F|nr:CAP domain-containing protein [Ornithinibacillus halophilus]